MSLIIGKEAVCYRVETVEGVGMFFHMGNLVYSDDRETRMVHKLFESHRDFNNPKNDGLSLSIDGVDYFCAYKSKADMSNWLGLDMAVYLTEEHGLRIFEMTIADYQEGFYQYMYDLNKVTNKVDITKEYIKQLSCL